MQKKLTVLFAFAIFVLVVGLQTDSYACHKDGGSNHKDCAEPSPSGGGSDILLCVTLADGIGNPGIGGIDGDERFCQGRVHERAIINRPAGVLDVSLFSLVTPRIRLDFSNCVNNCSKDFPDEVTGVEEDGIRLSVIGFNSDDTLDFTSLTFNGSLTDSDNVDLVVRLGLAEGPQIRRMINYGTPVEGCPSDQVRVTRLTNGCWEVESTPSQEACLFKVTGRGKKASIDSQGRYRLPFLLTLQTFTGFDDEDEPTGLDMCGV